MRYRGAKDELQKKWTLKIFEWVLTLILLHPRNLSHLLSLFCQPHPQILSDVQKHPFRGVLRKRCSENMQQMCKRTPMPKCYFNDFVLLVEWTSMLNRFLNICCEPLLYWMNLEELRDKKLSKVKDNKKIKTFIIWVYLAKHPAAHIFQIISG